MKIILGKILDLLINSGVLILFAAIVCFILDYKLFDLNDFGFQLFIFALLTAFIAFANKHLGIVEIFLISLIWGFIFAYLLRRTSVIHDFKKFSNLLVYTETLFISFSGMFLLIWNRKKLHLRGLVFALSAAVAYSLVHLLTHQILAVSINARQILYYFSNGLVIMLTMSLGLNTAAMLSRELAKNFFGMHDQ